MDKPCILFFFFFLGARGGLFGHTQPTFSYLVKVQEKGFIVKMYMEYAYKYFIFMFHIKLGEKLVQFFS